MPRATTNTNNKVTGRIETQWQEMMCDERTAIPDLAELTHPVIDHFGLAQRKRHRLYYRS